MYSYTIKSAGSFFPVKFLLLRVIFYDHQILNFLYSLLFFLLSRSAQKKRLPPSTTDRPMADTAPRYLPVESRHSQPPRAKPVPGSQRSGQWKKGPAISSVSSAGRHYHDSHRQLPIVAYMDGNSSKRSYIQPRF